MLAIFITICSLIPQLMGAHTTMCDAEPIELPKRVQNIELECLDKGSIFIPYWGERNILIFYIDPDNQAQNREFTIELREKSGCSSHLENLYALGVVNMKDAPLIPRSVARSVAKKKALRDTLDVVMDLSRGLAGGWGLGDCNNEFVMLLVNKNCELVYVHKGDLSQEQIDEFYTFIEDYI